MEFYISKIELKRFMRKDYIVNICYIESFSELPFVMRYNRINIIPCFSFIVNQSKKLFTL